jgi:hypothetical protein
MTRKYVTEAGCVKPTKSILSAFKDSLFKDVKNNNTLIISPGHFRNSDACKDFTGKVFQMKRH